MLIIIHTNKFKVQDPLHLMSGLYYISCLDYIPIWSCSIPIFWVNIRIPNDNILYVLLFGSEAFKVWLKLFETPFNAHRIPSCPSQSPGHPLASTAELT